MKTSIIASVLAIGLAATAADFDWPLISIRTNDRLDVPPEKFEPIFRVIAENPGCCDEIWFCCDGYRNGDFIARQSAATRMREMCEKAGTRLSFQQGVTLGHSNVASWPPKRVETGDGVATVPEGLYPFTEDAWQVDRGGRRLFGLLCPRSPETLAFVHDYVKAVVENARPMTYWLDDDLRMGIHKPDGCFCDRCLAEFNRKNGTALSRQALVGRLYDKKTKHEPLRRAWCDFNAESLAVYGASAAKAIEETGSPCRLAYQSVWSDTIYTGRDTMPLLRAISDNGRRPTGIRPGAGLYRDNQDGAAGVVLKCLSVAREAERCRAAGGIVGSVSYENETYPRHYLSKTPAAIITECAVAMASGSDAVSVYGYCTESFDPITEHEILFRRLAAARPYFERMRRESLSTRLGGIARYIGSRAAEMPDFDLRDEADMILALMGVPVTCVESGTKAFYITRKSISESTGEELAAVRAKGALEGFDTVEFCFTPDAAARSAILDKADSLIPGGMPVRLMDSRSIRVLPRVNAAGRTTAVTLFNTSFGFAEGFELRVRRPAGNKVVWMAPDGLVVDFTHARSDDEIVIRVKGLPGGAVGTYFFEEPAIAPKGAASAVPAPPVHDLLSAKWKWGEGTVCIDGVKTDWPHQNGPLAVEVVRVPDAAGFGFHERYVFRNVSDRPIALSEIDINSPFNDNYLGMEKDGGARRCHAHVWPGGSSAWVNAMRMNGKAPHLGLVVVEGAITGYELKRRSRAEGGSDSRGLICLSPPDVTLPPGGSYAVAWRVFEHGGHDDFLHRLVELGGVKVTADRWTVTKRHPATVTFEWKGGRETRIVKYERDGEVRVPFAYGDGRETYAELNAIADPLEHVLRRARFIVAHQQFLKEGDPYDGAFVQYDTETCEQHLNWIAHGTADWAPGAERFGIPVSLALLVQRGYTEFLAPLKRFARFAETLRRADGYVYADLEPGSRKRDFNSPWAAEFFLEFGKATGERRYFELGYGILRDLYGRIGPHRLVESRELESVEILRAAGMTAEADELVKLFASHKDAIVKNGGGVSREVNFAPEGAAGIISQFLDCYVLTGRRELLDYVVAYRPWFEANFGHQPSWHSHDIGLHHWDGYWFGKRKCWGDTLPHHWNGTAIDAFKALAVHCGDQDAAARALPIAEQLLGLVRPDGTAGCAFVYPNRVNGEKARFLDPLANDQDWVLAYYLRNEK